MLSNGSCGKSTLSLVLSVREKMNSCRHRPASFRLLPAFLRDPQSSEYQSKKLWSVLRYRYSTNNLQLSLNMNHRFRFGSPRTTPNILLVLVRFVVVDDVFTSHKSFLFRPFDIKYVQIPYMYWYRCIISKLFNREKQVRP